MRRYCYTLFLTLSLIVYALGPGEIRSHGFREETADIYEDAGSAGNTGSAHETGNVQQGGSVPKITETADVKKSEYADRQENGSMENGSSQPDTGVQCLFPENFQNVLFIGDSRTVGLSEYGQFGEADVFADSGMSVFSLWESEISSGGSGKKKLEQFLMENQYQTIHFMLGINELGYPMPQIVEKYRESVKKIQNMQPDAGLVLGANLHVTSAHSAKSSIYNNNRIDELNDEIQKIGEGLDCYFIDVNEIFDDGQGNLSKEYSADGSHVLGKYYADWVQWICRQR